MRTSRTVVVLGGSAAILAAGYATAPKELGDGGVGEAAQGDGVFTGPAVSNLRGTYQAQIVVEDGALVDVVFLTAGTSAAESVAINSFALPELREKFLAAQTWDVEYVSGSSYTSPAMVESVREAFADAGLG